MITANFDTLNYDHIEGVIDVLSVTDPDDTPNRVLDLDRDWKVEISWLLRSDLPDSEPVDLIDGTWNVKVGVESIGPGDEKSLDEIDIPLHSFVTSSPAERTWKHTFTISAGSITTEGVYQLVTLITYRDPAGGRRVMAGFAEGPMLTFFKDVIENDTYSHFPTSISDLDATFIHIKLTSILEEPIKLTLESLESKILPYLSAIRDIQYVIDGLSGKESKNILLKSISQFSPISISLAGVSEAIQVILDNLIPWRRKHSNKIAHLIEQEKQAEIEYKKAETLEKRANAQRNRADAEKILAEATREHEEAKKLKLQNESLRLELNQSKIQMVLDIIEKLNPHLSEKERNDFLEKMLPPVDVIIFNDIEISRDTTLN